jgi:hypothetical protein
MGRPKLEQCGRGHPMSGDNLRVDLNGRRRCKACERVLRTSPRPRITRPWTTSEINTIRELYPTHTARQIAQALGRTAGVVAVYAWKLGLKKRAAA